MLLAPTTAIGRSSLPFAPRRIHLPTLYTLRPAPYLPPRQNGPRYVLITYLLLQTWASYIPDNVRRCLPCLALPCPVTPSLITVTHSAHSIHYLGRYLRTYTVRACDCLYIHCAWEGTSRGAFSCEDTSTYTYMHTRELVHTYTSTCIHSPFSILLLLR